VQKFQRDRQRDLRDIAPQSDRRKHAAKYKPAGNYRSGRINKSAVLRTSDNESDVGWGDVHASYWRDAAQRAPVLHRQSTRRTPCNWFL